MVVGGGVVWVVVVVVVGGEVEEEGRVGQGLTGGAASPSRMKPRSAAWARSCTSPSISASSAHLYIVRQANLSEHPERLNEGCEPLHFQSGGYVHGPFGTPTLLCLTPLQHFCRGGQHIALLVLLGAGRSDGLLGLGLPHVTLCLTRDSMFGTRLYVWLCLAGVYVWLCLAGVYVWLCLASACRIDSSTMASASSSCCFSWSPHT